VEFGETGELASIVRGQISIQEFECGFNYNELFQAEFDFVLQNFQSP
jgi:hypothetical protein